MFQTGNIRDAWKGIDLKLMAGAGKHKGNGESMMKEAAGIFRS